MQLHPIVTSLILLIIANGVPVLMSDIMRTRWARAVDNGHLFVDRRPWFGASKTWRGLLAAVICTALAGYLLQVGLMIGAALGALSMLGDLLSSFCKRRLGMVVSDRAWLLDQVPESVLPVIILWQPLGLDSWAEAGFVVVMFILLDILMSPLLYRLHIRKRPY